MIWLTPDRFHHKPDKSSWLEMARHLRVTGHRITILTGGCPLPELAGEEGLVTVVGAVDLPLLFRFSLLVSMALWLRRNGTVNDIVLLNPDALWLIPILRLSGLRRIHLDVRTLPVDVYGVKNRLDKLLFWTLPLKWLGRMPTGYSFITRRLKIEVEKVLGRPIGDYVIWESGVNGNLFRPQPPNRGEPSPGRQRLFYHGTLSLNRGIATVIEATSLLVARVDMEFVIVGDGSGAQQLRTLTRQLGLEERVLFRGLLPYERMVDEINDADLCISPLPDRPEWNVSSPLKVFEYMACAKPMVATPISAHRDLLAGESFVVWSDGFGAASLCQAIEQAFSDLPSLTRAAAVGPALVAKRHAWGRQAEKLERYVWRPDSKRLSSALEQ